MPERHGPSSTRPNEPLAARCGVTLGSWGRDRRKRRTFNLPSGPGPGARSARPRVASSSVRGDAQHPPGSSREAEALLGDVEGAVGTNGHAGWEHEPRDHRLGGMARTNAHDRARPRSRTTWRGAQLERVHLPTAESEPDHLLEARGTHPQVFARGEHVDVLVRRRPVRGPEEPEVADVPDAVVGESGRNNMPNLGGEVEHAADRSGLSHTVELTMVR